MSCNYEAFEGTKWKGENLKIVPLILKQMLGETQIRKICAIVPYISYLSDWKDLLEPVDDFLESESIGGHWVHRMDFWTKTKGPTDLTLIKLIGKVMKKAFKDIGVKIKEIANQIWNVLLDSWEIIKMVIYCIIGTIVVVCVTGVTFRSLGVCVKCRQLQQVTGKARYRKISLTTDLSESETDVGSEEELRVFAS